MSAFEEKPPLNLYDEDIGEAAKIAKQIAYKQGLSQPSTEIAAATVISNLLSAREINGRS